jgi:hypothetical protein
MKMNVQETEVMKISRGQFPLAIVIDQKQLDDVEYFSYLARMKTDNARCTREIKFQIALAKSAFNQKKNLLPANGT